MIVLITLALIFSTYFFAVIYGLLLERRHMRERSSVNDLRNVVFLKNALKVRSAYRELYRQPIYDDLIPKSLKNDKVA